MRKNYRHGRPMVARCKRCETSCTGTQPPCNSSYGLPPPVGLHERSIECFHAVAAVDQASCNGSGVLQVCHPGHIHMCPGHPQRNPRCVATPCLPCNRKSERDPALRTHPRERFGIIALLQLHRGLAARTCTYNPGPPRLYGSMP